MDKLLMRKLKKEKDLLLNSLAKKDLKFDTPKKIMVIDDCKDTLHIIDSLLEYNNKFITSTYDNEYEALRKFIYDKPDLVILDMNLKNLDGIKVSIIFKNLTMFEVPVLFISQDKWIEKEIINFYGRSSTFLSKPLQKDCFINTVSGLLKF